MDTKELFKGWSRLNTLLNELCESDTDTRSWKDKLFDFQLDFIKEYRKAVQFEIEQIRDETPREWLEPKTMDLKEIKNNLTEYEEARAYLTKWQDNFLIEVRQGFDKCKNIKECFNFYILVSSNLYKDRLGIYKTLYSEEQAISINLEIGNSIYTLYTKRVNNILNKNLLKDPPRNIKEEDLDDDLEILDYKEKGYDGFYNSDWEKMEK